jgi:DNA-binding transcriptional ArsR family regulator
MSATEVHADNGGTHTVPNATTEPELSKDKIFHLLQTPRRRHVLRYLKRHEGTGEMRDIAEQVAAWENETSVQALTSDERQRVYIPLYQSHLPKLDEEGIIEYNQSRGTVKRTKLADQLDRYLTVEETETDDEAESERELSWESCYLSVSVFSTILLAGAVLGIPVLATLPTVAIGGTIVAMFSFVTLAQVMAEQKRES